MDTLPAHQAIETLISDYYQLVFHTIYGLTGNWEESQDLTQDTFLQALKGINAARAISGKDFQAKAWLLRIALNSVRMQRRRQALFHFIPFSHLHKYSEAQGSGDDTSDVLHEQAFSLQPHGYGVHAAIDPAELIAEQEIVQHSLARLPEALRICLLLSIVADLSHAEIAHLLDLKEPAVRQRLARARKQFQQAYRYESNKESETQAVTTSTSSSHQTDKPSSLAVHSESMQKKTVSSLILSPSPLSARGNYGYSCN